MAKSKKGKSKSGQTGPPNQGEASTSYGGYDDQITFAPMGMQDDEWGMGADQQTLADDDGGWGAAQNEAAGMWANGPSTAHIVPGSAQAGGGGAWGESWGAAVSEHAGGGAKESPASVSKFAGLTSLLSGGNKKKKSAAAAPPPPPPPPPPEKHANMNSGWGGGGGGGGWSDHRNDGEDEWDAVARSEAWDTPAQAMGWGDPPPAQAPAQPPAVAQYSQAAWSQWHAEAKGAPKVITPSLSPAAVTSPASSSRVTSAGGPALSQQQQRLRALLSHPSQTKDSPSQPHQPAAQQNAMRAQQQALQAALQAAQQRQPPPQSLAAQLQQQTIKQEKIRHAQLQQQAAAAMHSHSRAPSHRQHRQHQHPSSQSRHPPVQQNNSWGTWGTQAQDSGWGDIQEEDEEEDEEEEEEYDEEEEEYADEGWGNEYAHRVRFTPSVAQSYESQHHAAASHYSPAQSTHRAQTYRPPTQSTSFSPAYAANARLASQARPYKFWAGPGSKTMEMATGNHFQVGGANGAAFPIIESQGVALDPARTALFGHTRPPKDRIHWGFNPEKDPRVGSLLRWIQEMSSSLGALGLQKFLQTGERGALISNAAYRTDADSAVPNQPAFDWITVTYLHKTLDRILQESVVCYDPASQVIVFVFLLSKSGNSMAVWRKKINLSETIRQMHYGAILSVTGQLKELPVYVDVLPAKPEEPKKKGILSKRKWFKLGK